MKTLGCWLIAALSLAGCSSGSNHDRGGAGSGGTQSESGSGGLGAGNPGGGGPSQGGSSSNGGSNSNGGTGTTSGGSGATTGGTPGSSGSVGYSLNCPAPSTGRPVLRLFTRFEFENTINDVFPAIKGQWTNSLPANTVSGAGFDNDSANSPGNQFVSGLLESAESVGALVAGSALANLLPCSSAAADRACAGTFVDQFGRRLFRRPVTAAEKERYLAFFDTTKAATDFKTAIKWIAAGLVQSPNAVFRSEVGMVANGARQLTPYEVASELSYAFTGSAPSDELLTKAASGNLGDLAAIAKGLLATEPGQRMVQRFFEGYLEYPRAAAISKTNITSPAFSTVNKAMVQETSKFVEDVILKKGGGLKQLLTANTTNPSKDLATYYGFPAPGADYASITRPAGKGIGVLAQGAFLSSHANSDASSPTQRGLFPFYRLLCQPKLTAPADVPSITVAKQTNTTRERYEIAHTSAGTSCPACHKRFDPIGFGFEHFDEGGRYRDMQGGEAINSAAEVPGPDGKPLFSFKTQEELVTGLADLPVAYQCFSAYLATYTFGTTESCLGSNNVAGLQAGTIGVVDALASLASAPNFTQRKAQ
ncbi:MAG TPA: DUF1592 domain-containing protein [Polyangiaceae bacterium]|nr:DUF1592 domain-containing protein [Polyangiaceae bacterium]